ncbi:MAG TPA: NB-ARC domain-containing protein [Pseudolysinimonas sp.]|nr:NB-ARC domain-containing protein [Pseudolysinimonas sp.]
MKIGLFGGWRVEQSGQPLSIAGGRQRGLLFRLALETGSAVGYRALAEDLWSLDVPENPRAALQSLVSRLRPQLPDGILESVPGGYRLALARDDVDAVHFQDLVADARNASPGHAANVARSALQLWTGEPWVPDDGYDWFARALADDRRVALQLADADDLSATDQALIPANLTGLIGRDAELATVDQQLDRSRIVTILGTGGAGKTRLAEEAARQRGGAVLVEWAPVGADDLWATIATALGRDVRAAESPPTTTSPRERALASLAGRDILLVLDNCEHVIAAAADVVHEMSLAMPRLRILATSREPLGVLGEAFVPLGPLTAESAARLFDERVRAARGVSIGKDEADAARRIQSRLDGLPLALELAAAKARTLTLDEIATGLDDRFALLTSGPRTVLPRHQTLRALVDWSWDLLEAGERTMLDALATYPAGVATSDSGAVATAHGGRVSDIDALVDKSLVQRGGGRFRMLETIREYCLERLTMSGELLAHQEAQSGWLGRAAMEHDALLRGPGIHSALAWFDAESDNIIAALRASIADRRRGDVLRLAAGTTWYWILRDQNDEAKTWLDATAQFVQEEVGGLEASDEAVFVQGAALLAEVFRSFGVDDPSPTLTVSTQENRAAFMARAAASSHDLLQVMPIIIEAFSAAIDRGGASAQFVTLPADPDHRRSEWANAALAVGAAVLAHNRGDIAELGSRSAAGLVGFTDTGDTWGLALAQQMRAEWLSVTGQLAEALAMTDLATETLRTVTSSRDLQQQQGLALSLLVKLGRIDEARERARQLRQEAQETGSVMAQLLATTGSALLAIQLGDSAFAAECVDTLEPMLEEWPKPPPQLSALVDMARGGRLRLAGDLDGAEVYLRSAADAAVGSRDHPVMAAVAIAVGCLALERGDLGAVAQALSVAVSLRGAADPHEPGERRLRAALALGRKASSSALALSGATAELDQSEAAVALGQILRR